LIAIKFRHIVFSRQTEGVMEVLSGGIAPMHGIGHQIGEAGETAIGGIGFQACLATFSTL